MPTVRVPGLLKELFGQRSTRPELWLTLGFGVAVTALLLAVTRDEWRTIALWRQLALVVLAFDIGGGVLATLTYSTSRSYRNAAKARLRFILSHIQPVVLAFLLDSAYLVAVGVTVLLLTVRGAPIVLMALFAHHMFKVIYGFAVDHYARRAGERGRSRQNSLPSGSRSTCQRPPS